MLQKLLSIFKSSTGNYDLGRIISLKVSLIFSGSFGFAVFHNHQVINWAEAGGGFSAMLLGIGGLIAVKEVGIAKAGAVANATSPQ